MDITYDKKVNKKNVKSYSIPIDIYKVQIKVFFQKENENLGKHPGWEMPPFVAAGVQNYLDTCGDIVLRFNTKSPRISELSHEAVHIATAILHRAGHNFATSNDEPLAYLQGYVVEKVLELGKKHNIRFKIQ